ncbi:YbaK/EbsC family protein [Thermasporomyces composti]|jgi:prolyl-tRNA editing enzyme YbaK/EbsC (Cys-tRNA(Pro) deacylase)|uniref:Prolyl-tRNA editing enzyme YbaK/EbsC (Cys-tRNA(Pro) deacylase) n=1 Tax=Thermasporomyces composti TaxID=696763 RepID=A0A3D9VC85_THECX|nr:YbaK/EbsC family protein [Thermasporomyces composti]REF38313.1 prolyl-tRNA editing enzyme YbaK/EbsC (Cys-tRNA(Pro) deacylase) [Thermasporomyces composti]
MRPIGTLHLQPALDRPDLLAPPVAEALRAWHGKVDTSQFQVAEIDPNVADTAAFCATYDVPLDQSANCVIIAGRRGGETRYAACVVLATTRADVNGLTRRRLEARKASFAPMESAVSETGMEYGGITPVGLPETWPILVDAKVAEAGPVVIGSGLRRSKLVVPGEVLTTIPGAEVHDGLGIPA